MYVCMYVCMYACMHVCVHVHVNSRLYMTLYALCLKLLLAKGVLGTRLSIAFNTLCMETEAKYIFLVNSQCPASYSSATLGSHIVPVAYASMEYNIM